MNVVGAFFPLGASKHRGRRDSAESEGKDKGRAKRGVSVCMEERWPAV